MDGFIGSLKDSLRTLTGFSSHVSPVSPQKPKPPLRSGQNNSAQAEGECMITFKSVGHFFATVYEKIVAVIPKIAATESTAETVTAAVPVYGPLGLSIEKAGYAVLGELSSVLNAGGEAVKAKLSDAGLDQNVIATVEALIASVPRFATLAKTL